MATQADPREFDLQEQLARIRKMGAEHDQAQAVTHKLVVEAQLAAADVEKRGVELRLTAVDVEKRQAEIKKLIQDTEHASRVLVLQGLVAGAGITAAVGALAKLFL